MAICVLLSVLFSFLRINKIFIRVCKNKRTNHQTIEVKMPKITRVKPQGTTKDKKPDHQTGKTSTAAQMTELWKRDPKQLQLDDKEVSLLQIY